MIIVGCSGAKHIANRIAKYLKADYSELEIKKFPDNELNIRFKKNVRKKVVVLVQSFHGKINEKIIETLFALHTARELKSKKVFLVALHFPYLRKDRRFKSGECVSFRVMNELFRKADKLFIVEPHLHRIKNLKKMISNGRRITVVQDIAGFVRKLKLKDPLFIGPDVESFQWARKAAELLGVESVIFRKERKNSRSVKVKPTKKLNVKGRDVVIVDDIISTGQTMIESIKELKKLKPRKIYCIAIHGIFAENALAKLSKHAKVISTNTISSKASKIDIAKTVALNIK